MNKTNLFSDFEAISSKAFKQKINVDLKGEDYSETLVWESPEGIKVKPFYHRDQNEDFISIDTPLAWNIGEDIFLHSALQASQEANKAFEKGTEVFYFIADTPFEIADFFSELSAEIQTVYFKLNFLDTAFAKALLKHANLNKKTIYLNVDIISNLALSGNWYKTNQQDHSALDEILKENGNVLSIDLGSYLNAGGNNIQQLAYGLAHVNEYLNFANNQNIGLESITFEVGVGTNYFFEIAKLRALRLLYTSLIQEYKNDVKCHIIARPALRNKTIYDYNTNMLRTTTECMSAIIGGADTVINMPYDYIYHKRNNFGQRISRNQLIILKKESYFEDVSNPADGSYYIEHLTQKLAEEALNLFKSIEKKGGFVKQLFEGTIQRKLKESAEKENKLFEKGTKILLGTNLHPNQKDTMKENLELYPFLKHNSRKTIIEPIIPYRLAENIEQERLKSET